MRRSTAAAVGTLTGAALIMAVRLSVTTSPLAAAPPAFDLSEADANGQGAAADDDPTPKPSASKSKAGQQQEQDDENESEATEAPEQNASGLKNGKFTGKPVTHPYGTVQVAITIAGGKLTAVAVSAPNTGNSGAINAGAVPKLKRDALAAQSAEVDAVSGATYTSSSYVESLQAALDSAKA